MLSLFHGICIVVAAALFAVVAQALYRLSIHPLAHFPGPKLAAATKWYELWYDILVPPGGQFSRITDQLHDEYGPIVRINPEELHIRDPDMYETVYASSVKRDKWYNAARMTGKETDSFSTIPHELHRRRRMANTPMMTRRKVNANESIIQTNTMDLVANVQRAADSGDVLDLSVVFVGYTLDVVAAYFFDQTIGAQEDLELARKWRQITKSMSRMTPIMKQFPVLAKLAAGLPTSVVKRLWPDAGVAADLEDQMLTWATNFRSEQKDFKAVAKGADTDPNTLFEAIEGSKLPEEEKTASRLVDEGIGVIIAGSETTAKVLTRATYELMCNPSILTKAREELSAAGTRDGQSQLHLLDLERLPYLTALVRESLRITAIATSRFPVQLHEPLQYKCFDIPAMTPISLTPASILHDSSIFPEPKTFRPERWLSKSEYWKTEHHSPLERYFVPFGKGPRMCQGVHLAWAEMYFALASLISEFDFEPEDLVKKRDIDFVGDYFVGGVREDSPGVRVKVRKVD